MTVVSTVPTRSAAAFTRSRFAGPSVTLSRASALARSSRGIAVLAGNANVATGHLGTEHATEVRARVARIAGIPARQLVVGSTGVVGQPYPMELIRRGLDRLTLPLARLDLETAASAMMTGDTRPKSIHLRCGDATLVGIAKGGGIIEHDRATVLVFFFSDADVPADELEQLFRAVMGRTFTTLGGAADTATSDTAAILANGLAGPVRLSDFETELESAALDLARQIAAENEHACEPCAVDVAASGAQDANDARA